MTDKTKRKPRAQPGMAVPQEEENPRGQARVPFAAQGRPVPQEFRI
jgi:hypothetical protein